MKTKTIIICVLLALIISVSVTITLYKIVSKVSKEKTETISEETETISEEWNVEEYNSLVESVWESYGCVNIRVGEQFGISPNQEYNFITHNITSTEHKTEEQVVTHTIDNKEKYHIPKVNVNSDNLYKEIPIKGCRNLRLSYNTYRWDDLDKNYMQSLVEAPLECDKGIVLELCVA